MNKLKFSIDDFVTVGETDINGRVIGVVEYKYSRPLYLVAHMNKDGEPKEIWYNDSEIHEV